MSYEELIQRCIKRDGPSWDEFVRQYQGLVTRSVRYKLSKMAVRAPRSEIADIVQEIFLSLWEKNKLAEIRDPKCLKSWLAMLSLNTASNHYRSKAFRESSDTLPLHMEIGTDDNSLTLEETLPSHSFDTERILKNKDLSRLLEREMGTLSHKERLAVKLSIYDDKRQSDVAEIMNIPANSAATLIRRGKEKLRERLAEALKENRG